MKVKSKAELEIMAEAAGITRIQLDDHISKQLKLGIFYELSDGWYAKYE